MEKTSENIKATLERKVQLIKDSRHTRLYYMAVIDYHEYICSSKDLTNILSEIISEDKIAPIYLEEIFNDFLISQHLKYTIPQKALYPNFYTEKIEENYRLLKKFIEFIQGEYNASKLPDKIPFNPNFPMVKTERDEEFFYTQKLHNDIIEKIDAEQVKQETKKFKKYTLSFDDANRILHFMDEKIVIGKKEESDPHKLMRTLFSDTTKIWANDEILEDWGYSFDEEVSKNKVYQAGKAINQVVAQDTKIKDFLVISTKSVSINKKYLKP